MKRSQTGQGFVEYVLVLVLVAVVAIVAVSLLNSEGVGTLFELPEDRIERIYGECVAEERFTQEECFDLALAAGQRTSRYYR